MTALIITAVIYLGLAFANNTLYADEWNFVSRLMIVFWTLTLFMGVVGQLRRAIKNKDV